MPRHNKPKLSRSKRKRIARARDVSAARLAASKKHTPRKRVVEAQERESMIHDNDNIPRTRDVRKTLDGIDGIVAEIHDLSKRRVTPKRR